MKRQLSPTLAESACTQHLTQLSDEKQVQSDDLFAAAAAAAGIKVPNLFKTKLRRWAVLFLVTATSALASGPIGSWPTLEPILIKEGVFAGPSQVVQLSEIFSIATGLGMISNILNGVLFDVFGPRWVSAVGAWCCAGSLLLMAFAVKVQSMNWLLWIAYPAATFFGMMNTNGVYAWYWLLPESQNTVSSMTGSIQVLADSFVLIAVWINQAYGLSISFFFLLVAILAAFAGIIALYFVPTLDEHLAYSAAIAKSAAHEQEQLRATDASYGSCDNNAAESGDLSEASPTEGKTLSSAFSDVRDKIVDTKTWWVRLFPTVNLLFNLYMFFNYMWSVYPQFQMYPLYNSLMGTKNATRLVNVWGGVYPVAGTIFILAFGPFVDRFGYYQTIALLIPPTILNTFLYSVKSFDLQVVAQALLACGSNTWAVLSPRFCLHYAPAELFGTIYGLQGTILGLGQIIGTPVSSWITGMLVRLFDLSGGEYLITIYIWCALYIASTVVLLIYWLWYPLPEVGSCTMKHIRAAAAPTDACTTKAADVEYGAEENIKPSIPKDVTLERRPLPRPWPLSGACCMAGCYR